MTTLTSLQLLDALCEKNRWRLGLIGQLDGSIEERQTIIAVEVRQGEGRFGQADLVAVYPLFGRAVDGAIVEVPISVAAASLVEALSASWRL